MLILKYDFFFNSLTFTLLDYISGCLISTCNFICVTLKLDKRGSLHTWRSTHITHDLSNAQTILTHLATGHPCGLLPSFPVYLTFSILSALPLIPNLKASRQKDCYCCSPGGNTVKRSFHVCLNVKGQAYIYFLSYFQTSKAIQCYVQYYYTRFDERHTFLALIATQYLPALTMIF